MRFQNAPEGLLVALFLVNQRISKFKAFLLATLTGAIVPYGLSFAAGAMLFIIYKELIPESHGDGNERVSTYAFITGLLVMVFIIDIF